MPGFREPLHASLDPDTAALRTVRTAGELRCTCPSVFCRGQASVDWLSCDRACRACKPPPWTPPVHPGPGELDADQ
jgi:hypothetical protein